MAEDRTSDTHPDDPQGRIAVLQLKRLERLVDVVFGIVLWRLFTLLPSPTEEQLAGGPVVEFLLDEVTAYVAALVGLAFTIIYWLQSNKLLGNLKQTDDNHTAITLLQVFVLLFFLGVVAMSVAFEPSTAMRALESGATAAVGLVGAWGWAYATRNRHLLEDSVTTDDALTIRNRITAEPATALLALCLSPFPLIWELSWFSYPLMVGLFRRRRGEKAAA